MKHLLEEKEDRVLNLQGLGLNAVRALQAMKEDPQRRKMLPIELGQMLVDRDLVMELPDTVVARDKLGYACYEATAEACDLVE